jgi:hypothetical protein
VKAAALLLALPLAAAAQVDYSPLRVPPVNVGQAVLQAEQARLLREMTAALKQDREAAAAAAAAEQPAQPATAAVVDRFMAAIKYRRYRWPDFDATVFRPDLPMTQDMVGLMAESPLAADIAYHLGKNPGEAAAIAAMPLPDAGRAIFALEARIRAPAPPAE